MIYDVYMPFFQQGNGKQTELCIETIDKLQACMDNYATLALITNGGDFSCALPREK